MRNWLAGTHAAHGLCAVALLAFAALAAPTGARAQAFFSANLTHDQEPPPAGTTPLVTSTGDPRPLSFGNATLVLNEAETALSMTATIYNIDVTGTQTPNDTNDNLASAHIHGPAAPGASAGVRWGFFGAPLNDNNPNDFILTPFASGVGGTFQGVWNQPEGNNTTLDAQLTNLRDGLLYLNFHTGQFGGGEIRGQIVPGVIPEPGSLALLATGLLPLAGIARRRRSA